MGIKTFAAIDVGSYELGMKIFEFGKEGTMREIDFIRHRIDLGTQTYATGKLSNDKVNELCRVLRDFQTVMRTYQVEDYKAYGTSAIREVENNLILLDQIQNRTGIRIDVLSNSEQRFLDYKSIAMKGEKFNKFIEKGTAIVDIGGGSLQISLFDRDSLVATQNIRLGILRIKDILHTLQPRKAQLEDVIGQLISRQLDAFRKLYLKDTKIDNIIVVDDYVSTIMRTGSGMVTKPGFMEAKQFGAFLAELHSKTESELAAELGMEEENVEQLLISGMTIMSLIRMMGAELLWAPGVTLCDGIAYEYAEKRNKTVLEHDFNKDILACARNINYKYHGNEQDSAAIEKITMSIYDAMKKIHGLSKRERLLLRLSGILQDCGKYISIANAARCAYDIIMATEIIGLSHKERAMVANIIKASQEDGLDMDRYSSETIFEAQDYLVMAKLTAILKVANGLAITDCQKFRDLTAGLKDYELVLSVPEGTDVFLERGLFDKSTEYFEEVYSIKPVIRVKK